MFIKLTFPITNKKSPCTNIHLHLKEQVTNSFYSLMIRSSHTKKKRVTERYLQKQLEEAEVSQHINQSLTAATFHPYLHHNYNYDNGIVWLQGFKRYNSVRKLHVYLKFIFLNLQNCNTYFTFLLYLHQLGIPEELCLLMMD